MRYSGRNVGHREFFSLASRCRQTARYKMDSILLTEHLFIFIFNPINKITSKERQHLQNNRHVLTEAVKSGGSVL